MAGRGEGGKARCFRTWSSPPLPGCLFKVEAHMSKDNLFLYVVWCPASCYKPVIICVCWLARHSFFTPNFSLWNHSTVLCVSILVLQWSVTCCPWARVVTRHGRYLHTTAVWVNLSSTPVRISLVKTKNPTDLPRRLSTVAETGFVGIYQIIYHARRHTLLLVLSHNSCALKNMTLQVWKFLSALFKNGLKEVPKQKV